TYILTRTGANEDLAETGDLDIRKGMTIWGAGANNTLIDGNASDRIFDVIFGSFVSISHMRVTNGNVAGWYGGGILAQHNGDFYLGNVLVDNNTSTSFGGGLIVINFVDKTNAII